MKITLDRDTLEDTCHECESLFTVIRGSVYGDEQPFGLYLIALHGHSPNSKVAHLAVAVQSTEHEEPQAAAIVIGATGDNYTFGFTDWATSPWAEESYLGKQLDRRSALESDCRSMFLHIAEHIVYDLPEFEEYLRQEH
jgi:hypothetical protein